MGSFRQQDQLPLRTLQRGLRILEVLSRSTDGLNIHELAKHLDLSTRTCYYLLERLSEEGYVVRFVGGRYGLGPKPEELQRFFSLLLAPDQRVLDAFARLHERAGRQVSLNGWYGSEIVIQRSYSDRNATSSVGAGFRDCSTSRCSTKAILAFVAEKQLQRHFASRAHRSWTERTITDFQLFREHLLEVAKRGYALDLGETADGLCGIGAPFFTDSGFPLGSFGISALEEEFRHQREELIDAILDAGTEASQALGYSGPYPPPTPLRRK